MTVCGFLTPQRIESSPALDAPGLGFMIALVAIVGARVAALFFNPIGLYFDEAQYWDWSRTLDWGYYTKPPMVAWTIAATTYLFGDAEWAVRLAAPIAHGFTALALYGLGREIYGRWSGFWSGLAWLVMPAVWFSSSLISTDVLLLPFWSLGLYALYRLVDTHAWGWAAFTGVCIGFGMQAKYAMLYFPICMMLAAIWLPSVRAALEYRIGLIAAIALIIIAPNLLWNMQHGFATVTHTAENGNFGGELFNLDEMGDFIGSQILLVGPLMFFAMVVVLWRAARRPSRFHDEGKFLLVFTLPPLLVVTALSFITRANANWAVVSYTGATVLLVGALLRSNFGKRWFGSALALNIAIGIGVIVVALMPALASEVKGVREASAWDVTAQAVAAQVEAAGPVSAIMVDDRTLFYQLNYYWRRHGEAPAPLRMWLLHGRARNSAELDDPMRVSDGARVLVVQMSREHTHVIAADFNGNYRITGETEIPLGAGRTRKLTFGIGEHFAPIPRDRFFHDRATAYRDRYQ